MKTSALPSIFFPIAYALRRASSLNLLARLGLYPAYLQSPSAIPSPPTASSSRFPLQVYDVTHSDFGSANLDPPDPSLEHDICWSMTRFETKATHCQMKVST